MAACKHNPITIVLSARSVVGGEETQMLLPGLLHARPKPAIFEHALDIA